MKPTIISPETKKTELKIILLCFIVSLTLNILGIIIFETSWKELFTQIHIVLLLTLIMYVVIILLRIIFSSVKKVVFGKKLK